MLLESVPSHLPRPWSHCEQSIVTTSPLLCQASFDPLTLLSVSNCSNCDEIHVTQSCHLDHGQCAAQWHRAELHCWAVIATIRLQNLLSQTETLCPQGTDPQPSPSSGAHCLLFVSVSSTTPSPSCYWGLLACVLVRLTYFPEPRVLRARLRCSRCPSFLPL